MGGRDDTQSARGEAAELAARLKAEQRKLALVQEIGRALSSTLDPDQLLAMIVEKVTVLMDADRSTLYLLTDAGDELWSKVVQGGEVREIRLAVGEGIAGWVARSGETVVISDPYNDQRFQPSVDTESGYRTRSILCTPMWSTFGSVLGVLQVLNKRSGTFTGEDEELIQALASQAAVSIENSKLYQSVVSKNVELLTAQDALQQRTQELNVLYEIEREIGAAYGLDELLESILSRAVAMVGAEAGTVALVEQGERALRFRTTHGPAAGALMHRRLDASEGLLGWAVEHRQAVLSNDPASDPRHARWIADELGMAPQHLACAPLVAADEVLGAIELVNRYRAGPDERPGFTEGDLKLLTLIAGQASRAIQLARSKQERERQDRLAAVGQMLAGVLHDIRTPMTIISGYAQLMAQIDDPVEREHYREEILAQFDVMSGMTKEVLAFARGETTILVRKVYLNRFLEQLEKQLRHSLEGRGIELEIDARFAGVAHFDEQKLMRLAQNLARNAADAMPGGGRLRIATRTEGESLVLEFSDEGPGIPAELEGRLFELFESGREGGTGLGLAIVKKIVDEHNGSIRYASAAGRGTTFTITLPLGGRVASEPPALEPR
jgi:signal transduction histidine kinase